MSVWNVLLKQKYRHLFFLDAFAGVIDVKN